MDYNIDSLSYISLIFSDVFSPCQLCFIQELHSILGRLQTDEKSPLKCIEMMPFFDVPQVYKDPVSCPMFKSYVDCQARYFIYEIYRNMLIVDISMIFNKISNILTFGKDTFLFVSRFRAFVII